MLDFRLAQVGGGVALALHCTFCGEKVKDVGEAALVFGRGDFGVVCEVCIVTGEGTEFGWQPLDAALLNFLFNGNFDLGKAVWNAYLISGRETFDEFKQETMENLGLV